MTIPRFAFQHFSCTLVAVVLLCGSEGDSAEPESKPTDAREPDDSSPKDDMAKDRLKYMTNAMQKYHAVVEGDADKMAIVNTGSLLRWSNPVGDVVDGLLVVYAASPTARPAMIGHYHVHGSALNGLEMHEFADVHPGQVELYRGRNRICSR